MHKIEGFLLKETQLGWMISGSSPSHRSNSIVANICSIDDQLCMFWEQEELLETKQYCNVEKLCEELFENTHSRDKSGRYTVHLPFKKLLTGQELP